MPVAQAARLAMPAARAARLVLLVARTARLVLLVARTARLAERRVEAREGLGRLGGEDGKTSREPQRCAPEGWRTQAFTNHPSCSQMTAV